MTEKELIKLCQRGNPKAQKKLYDLFSPMLYGIVRRYIRDADDAEDVFVKAMYKILTKIVDFRGEGSFEGWTKRIAVNEALMFLRKNKTLAMTREIGDLQISDPQDIEAQIHADEIIALLDELPPGYRTVFNMYVIEGYKHREIAEELGISINTSKSQLILARKKLQSLIKKKNSKAI